jgi:hypothetical protein
MDEEDLQDIRDSRKVVDTADEMDLTGGTQAELHGRMGDPESEYDPICFILFKKLYINAVVEHWQAP